jgi:DsbC/DsbD-like thiol-disulfide interchange protein
LRSKRIIARRNLSALFAVIAFAAGNFILPGVIAGQESGTKPASVVKPQTFVSLDPVPLGQEFQIAVNVEISHGYHMNSHHPSDPYLIPTNLTLQAPAGIEILDTIYPAGRDQKFTFSPDKPLNVYSGNVTLKLKLRAGTSVPLGATTIPMTLRYQACNDTTCLPPVKLPVDAKFVVAAANEKARPVHPEVFAPQSSTK